MKKETNHPNINWSLAMVMGRPSDLVRCRSHQHQQESRVAFLHFGISFKVLLPHFVGVAQFCGWMELGQKPSLVLGSSTALHVLVHVLCECGPRSSCVHLGCHIAHKYYAKSLILPIPGVPKFPGITCWWIIERVWLSVFIYLRRWFSSVKHLGDAWHLKGSQNLYGF